MNKKKWLGATMSVISIASATQNFAFCEDLVDILDKDIVTNFLVHKDANISWLSEFARHRLRIARDEAVAYGIAGSMKCIVNKYCDRKVKEELEGILKKLSENKKNELFYHFLIDELFNITVKERLDYPAEHDIYAVPIPVVVKTPFKEDKKLLKELLDFGETEEVVLATYENYNQQMTKIENNVKGIVKKNGLTHEDIDAIKSQIKLAENVVQSYYTTPAGYIRYLASRGIFLDKKSFPGMDKEQYENDILVWYYSSKVPSLILGKAYDVGTNALGCSNPLFFILNLVTKPIVNKFIKKVDDAALYAALNQDPHMSSMFKPSCFCSCEDILDYVNFNFGEYLADCSKSAINAMVGA